MTQNYSRNTADEFVLFSYVEKKVKFKAKSITLRRKREEDFIMPHYFIDVQISSNKNIYIYI